MIRRVFWLGLGVAVGVVVVRKLTKAAESYSPRGLARSAKSSATGLLDSARMFADDVRSAMHEHQEELLNAIVEDTAPTSSQSPHTPTSP